MTTKHVKYVNNNSDYNFILSSSKWGCKIGIFFCKFIYSFIYFLSASGNIFKRPRICH